MSARYTVHLGLRSDEWPPQIGAASTRGEAQRMASAALSTAPTDQPRKAEVRERGVRLLDTYGRRGGTRVFHSYAAAQRNGGDSAEEATQ